MFYLKVRITKFRIQESNAIKRPRHIDLHFLLAFQRIRDVCTHAHQIAVGEIIRDVPVAIATELNAHVAKHMVEIKDRHVKRLRYLRGGQRGVSSAGSFNSRNPVPMISSAIARIFFGLGKANCWWRFCSCSSSSSQRSTNLARASSLNFVAM